MKRASSSTLFAVFVLASMTIVSWPALASEGCSAFRGSADHQTKGQGGERVGHGFDRGDTLTITIHRSEGQLKVGANLLEYASPNGPFRALTEDSPTSFTYTVPARTSDYIYLNFGSALPGMTVTWSCTPAK